MATQNNININVNVSDNGSVAQADKEAKKYRKTLEGIKKTLEDIGRLTPSTLGTPSPSIGGTAGSRAAAAASRRGASASSSPAGAAGMSGANYSEARGVAGVTGASARDFAAQSQGLGGLVRLYATYAANIYAVSAAFSALSRAMDTSNMVKGLDSLGASSGRALGTLSKQLVAVTDGTISMREAIESTAKASSSGMSSENILRMGKLAKQASQTLGVDMSDAISRLTRGITKLEPELLDELGLFTKTGKASQDYAKSVNKSVTELTDFEKRAAYANAVLAEGEAKFGKIQLDVNPYTKLLAVLKDTAQAGLELVNKVVVPLVSFLSQSPTALVGVIAAIGAVIVKQALPELLNYRKSMEGLAAKSKEIQASRLKDLKSSLMSESSEIVRALDDQAEIKAKKFEETSNKLNALAKASGSKRAKEISNKALPDITQDDLQYLDDRASKGTRVSAVYKEMADSIRDYAQTESEYKTAVEDMNAKLKDKHSLLTTAGQTELRYHNEVNKARTRELTSQIASTASTEGFTAALKKSVEGYKALRKEQTTSIELVDRFGNATGVAATVTTRGVGRIAAGIGLLKNVAVAAVASIGTAVAAFAPWLEVIGLIVSGFIALNEYMSKNSEEAAAFSTSLSALESSAKNVSDTVDALSKKDPLQQMSEESISARANAFKGLSDSISESSKGLLAADKAAGTWDKFIDGFKTLWGGDLASKFSDTVSKTITDSLSKLEGTPAAEAARKSISEILKLDPKFTQAELEAALKNIAKTAPQQLSQVEQAVAKVGQAMLVSAAKGTELQESIKKLGEARKKVSDSFIVKDDFYALGQSMVDTYTKLNLALQDPQQKLNAIKATAKELLNIPGTTLSEALGLQDAGKAAEDYQKALSRDIELNKQLITTEEKLAKLVGSTEKARDIVLGKKVQVPGLSADGLDQLKDLKKTLQYINEQKDINLSIKTKLDLKLEEASGDIQAAQLKIFKAGSEIISNRLSVEWAKAGTTISQAYASILSGTDAGIRLRAQSEAAVVRAQISLIEATRNNEIASRELALAIRQEALDRTKGGDSAPAIREAQSREQAAIDAERKTLADARSGKTQGAYKRYTESLGSVGATPFDKGGAEFAQGMEASGAQLAQLKAQLSSIFISEKDALISNKFKKLKEDLDIELQLVESRKKSVDLMKDVAGETNAAYVKEKQALDLDTQRLAQKSEMLAIDVQIARLSAPGVAKQPGTAAELARVEAQRKAAVTRQAKDESTLKASQAVDLINTKYKSLNKTLDDNYKLTSEIRAVETEQISISGNILEAKKSAGLLDEEYYTQSKYLLEISKEQNTFDTKSAEANYALDKVRNDELKRREIILEVAKQQGRDILSLTEAEAFALRDSQELEAKAVATRDQSVSAATRQRDMALEVLNVTNEAANSQLRWNTALADMSTIAESLGSVFGDLGTKLGALGTALVQAAKDQDTYAQKVLAAKEEVAKYDDRDDGKDAIAARNALAKAEKDRAKSEISNNIAIVASAKKMFGEKTAAAKALGAVEKVLHIQRIAMDMKELFSKLFTDKAETVSKIESEAEQTAATEAGFLARIPTYISEIFAKFTATMGPWGWAAAAAVVATLFGGSGGKASPAGFSAEEQQKVQGTGQAYVGGKLVDRAGGVLGDSTAKADALISSVDTLSKEVFGSLGSGSSKIVHELTAIKENTGQTVKALLGQIGMFGSNLSSFGTQEGSSKGSGLVGVLKSLWGSSSTTIKDTGIQVTGTLSALANRQGSFQEYENVQKKSSSWGGLKSKTRNFTNLKDLGDRAVQGLSNIFNSVSNVLVESAKVLEGDGSKAIAAIKDFPIDLKVSLKGLTGQDAVDAIMAELSTQLNAAAERAFPYLSGYQKIGEEFYETVARIVKDGETVTAGLAMVGKGITGLGIEAKVAAQQLLIDAVGGVDKFTTGIQYYFDNFLTDEERFRVNFTKLTGTFKQAGLQLPKTKQGYIDLMNSIDAVANPEAFAVVLNNAESYNTLLSEQSTILDKTASKFKDFATSLKDFRDGLLLGATSTLTPLEKYAKAQEDLNTVYSKAMSGDTDAMGKLQGASQTFLDISRGMYASGAQYSSDFSTVMDMLDKAQSFSQSKADTATLQLDALNEQLGYLKNIDGSLAILSGNTPAARGGWRSGITLVGEQGPEFVDFQTPGRVYTADQTAGMFSSPRGSNGQQAVIAELQALRTEVAQLRKEQQQQTGDLITTNYDAAQTLATNIADAVTQSAVDSAWQSRNVSAVK